MEFANLFAPGALAVLMQVVMIDAVLAGDNAIVVGSLAAGLPADQRKKVIAIGIAAALVLRIVFALLVTQLLQIVGLVLAGGLLLMWVAWRMYRDLTPSHAIIDVPGPDDYTAVTGPPPAKSFAAAAWSVAIADVSMSLDNVLAVAGAAHEHPEIMVVGLVLSVALMGVAANFIAKYIERYRWIAYVGLAVIVYVAGKMIWQGWHEVAPVVRPLIGG
ncbi:MAG: YjbE family putative metal transport protein [Sandarakinorhabdus sp.]|nr:YjbE family putative metal transport protein [Sandarakinorhabdus sp.]